MIQEKARRHELEVHSSRSLAYHLKTVHLFTKSDIKCVMIPQTLFTISSILTSGFRTIDAPPQLTATTLLRPLLHAVSWLYASLLLEDLANQRLPGSVAEDALNKPWRPVPAGRITPDEARQAALYLVPALMIFGAWSGAFRETAAFVAFVWMYNDLDAADASIFWRNATNGLGLAALSAGATVVASGGLEYSPPERAVVWILVTGLVVCTTIHAQDFPDVVGDSARGRKTIPLVYGDGIARASLAVGVLGWSFGVPAFWGLGWVGYVPTVGLGLAMCVGTLWRRTLRDDEVVWRLWCVWVGVIYLLPCFQVVGLPSSWKRLASMLS